MNLYACTLRDGWTAGSPNKDLKDDERTPVYYEYADNPDIAASQLRGRINTLSQIDTLLLKRDASPIRFKA